MFQNMSDDIKQYNNEAKRDIVEAGLGAAYIVLDEIHQQTRPKPFVSPYPCTLNPKPQALNPKPQTLPS